MKQIYMTRSGGSVRSILTVYSDGTKFKLHYLILGRTNPTKAEKAKGVKSQRFEILNNEFLFDSVNDINFIMLPVQKLTNRFKNEYLYRNKKDEI
ncbi:hypothetical protein Xish_03662 [Xenorhabdus ishibashii]|uniref:Uncharacterized protein n=1 Tax=Xenorhabdus ishibashii TaxID=1034471 RepID=A0A2D0K837_9GAMM|nr:hypothetical protein Xish_03638 [Xenorhabdus ishibashii]PHM59543.1 hypothetical protein Xish_03662 [Xenorhabdus ishibashii]